MTLLAPTTFLRWRSVQGFGRAHGRRLLSQVSDLQEEGSSLGALKEADHGDSFSPLSRKLRYFLGERRFMSLAKCLNRDLEQSGISLEQDLWDSVVSLFAKNSEFRSHLSVKFLKSHWGYTRARLAYLGENLDYRLYLSTMEDVRRMKNFPADEEAEDLVSNAKFVHCGCGGMQQVSPSLLSRDIVLVHGLGEPSADATDLSEHRGVWDEQSADAPDLVFSFDVPGLRLVDKKLLCDEEWWLSLFDHPQQRRRNILNALLDQEKNGVTLDRDHAFESFSRVIAKQKKDVFARSSLFAMRTMARTATDFQESTVKLWKLYASTRLENPGKYCRTLTHTLEELSSELLLEVIITCPPGYFVLASLLRLATMQDCRFLTHVILQKISSEERESKAIITELMRNVAKFESLEKARLMGSQLMESGFAGGDDTHIKNMVAMESDLEAAISTYEKYRHLENSGFALEYIIYRLSAEPDRNRARERAKGYLNDFLEKTVMRSQHAKFRPQTVTTLNEAIMTLYVDEPVKLLQMMLPLLYHLDSGFGKATNAIVYSSLAAKGGRTASDMYKKDMMRRIRLIPDDSFPTEAVRLFQAATEASLEGVRAVPTSSYLVKFVLHRLRKIGYEKSSTYSKGQAVLFTNLCDSPNSTASALEQLKNMEYLGGAPRLRVVRGAMGLIGKPSGLKDFEEAHARLQSAGIEPNYHEWTNCLSKIFSSSNDQTEAGIAAIPEALKCLGAMKEKEAHRFSAIPPQIAMRVVPFLQRHCTAKKRSQQLRKSCEDLVKKVGTYLSPLQTAALFHQMCSVGLWKIAVQLWTIPGKDSFKPLLAAILQSRPKLEDDFDIISAQIRSGEYASAEQLVDECKRLIDQASDVGDVSTESIANATLNDLEIEAPSASSDAQLEQSVGGKFSWGGDLESSKNEFKRSEKNSKLVERFLSFAVQSASISDEDLNIALGLAVQTRAPNNVELTSRVVEQMLLRSASISAENIESALDTACKGMTEELYRAIVVLNGD